MLYLHRRLVAAWDDFRVSTLGTSLGVYPIARMPALANAADAAQAATASFSAVVMVI